MSTPRELARIRTMAEITRLGWQHVESDGAAALSLRAVARDLGIVSSAIYRYVPSRDDLLTMLIAEGYRDLADAVEAALAAREATAGPAGARGRAQWLTVSHAVRDWARRRPAAWALLYGSPVPGYSAPPEETTPQGTRVVLRLGAILADAATRGEVDARIGPLAVDTPLAEPLAGSLRAIGGELGQDVPPAAVAQVILGWTSLLGAVSSEVFGQLGRDPFGDPDAFAALQLAAIADAVGLRES
ncbi:TetR family transcriptional regulator [Serinibacter arcticus]|uniref:TetR family transcriptional regulator n=1 Tax=Serinibacter arcticus TaxID=1655435 RepID=A0A2U1ZYX8_9MICO|nr:TetR-like C-terminal domain-containing protein [Serinibacter arcticus]PWD52187.1 TetR family transcriptional regulator [Serinibacter arcticus]